MSLHNTVCNKPRPCYKCTESLKRMTKTPGGTTIPDDFHVGWEYSIEYVERRLPKRIIENYFKILS